MKNGSNQTRFSSGLLSHFLLNRHYIPFPGQVGFPGCWLDAFRIRYEYENSTVPTSASCAFTMKCSVNEFSITIIYSLPQTRTREFSCNNPCTTGCVDTGNTNSLFIV